MTQSDGMTDFMKRRVVPIATGREIQISGLIIDVPNITASDAAVWVIGISGTASAGIGSCGVSASQFAYSGARFRDFFKREC